MVSERRQQIATWKNAYNFLLLVVILFDVKYEENDQDQEDENDGSDAKNNETFYENSIILNDNNCNGVDKGVENNNNYNFNNKNGDMSGLPDIECDLIQRALFMTLNEDINASQTAEELQSIESIKATLLKSKLQIYQH